MNWLLAAIHGAVTQLMAAGIAWHGCLMLVAWAILMPAGFLVVRFFKITPGQDWPRRLNNPFWFINHRRLGYATVIVTTIAIACILWANGSLTLWQGYHATTGWMLFALAWCQVLGSLFRGSHGGPVDPMTRKILPPEQWHGDHFNLTRRRIFFEYSHKIIGYILVPLTVWQIATGLRDLDASLWLWGAVALCALFFVSAFVTLQVSGRCVDTYQAIWGLDETLPGYRRKPIGWGITRFRGP